MKTIGILTALILLAFIFTQFLSVVIMAIGLIVVLYVMGGVCKGLISRENRR